MEGEAHEVKAAGSAVRGGRLAAGMRALGRAVLDQLYPPVCLVCDAAIADPDAICAACFARLRPITRPFCPVLGLPFEVPMGPEARSAEAIAHPPPFDRARSAVLYNGIARGLVSRLKYGDRPEIARLCARLMAAAGREFWSEKPLLVPVPLHRGRLFARRFNQSAELAREVARITGLDCDHRLVIRRRPTRHQVGLSGDQRRRNLEGAFALAPDALRRLSGRPVVLIDDVITTGATVRTIARVLKRGGVERIDVLSFARVVIGAETD
ncbi:comF family protein [Devosia enhydra]|uniref:ComF family protein n=1 Tax=Devosia enhydra TaxID=665118 RepID=A0A1K2I072_9HYPH|nr:ComF family protein [Devosia enhydra]SFZ85789.1 comF family protein [Devosia enhydra]